MNPDEIDIEVRHTPEAVVVAVSGELDIASAPALDAALSAAAPDGQRRLVVDLSGLEFMDSTGLHVLLAAARRAPDGGPRLMVRRGPPPVQQLFELTDTVSLFDFEH